MSNQMDGAPESCRTDNAMLVPWGLFAQRIGVVEALKEVSIPQRSRTYTPQTKLLEFLVSILSGVPTCRTSAEALTR